MRPPLLRASAIVTAVAFGGCSFVYVKGPGAVTEPPRTYPSCTEDSNWPLIDGVLSALWLFTAIYSVKESNDSRAAASSSFLLPLAFGASAVYGFTRSSACSDARASWRRAYPSMPNGPMPQPYGYPPPGYPPQGYQPPPQQQPPPGYEGGACAANNVCVQGLTCASGICVRPPMPQPQLGTEGNACSNNACDPGLTCASGLCVRVPSPAPR